MTTSSERDGLRGTRWLAKAMVEQGHSWGPPRSAWPRRVHREGTRIEERGASCTCLLRTEFLDYEGLNDLEFRLQVVIDVSRPRRSAATTPVVVTGGLLFVCRDCYVPFLLPHSTWGLYDTDASKPPPVAGRRRQTAARWVAALRALTEHAR